LLTFVLLGETFLSLPQYYSDTYNGTVCGFYGHTVIMKYGCNKLWFLVAQQKCLLVKLVACVWHSN